MLKKREMLKVEGYFEAFIILFLLGLFFYMLFDYIMPLLFAVALVFLFYKPYQFCVKHTKSEVLSALLMLILLILLIFVPFYWLVTSLVSETTVLVNSGSDFVDNFDLNSCGGYDFCMIVEENLYLVQKVFDSFVSNLGGYLTKTFGIFLSGIGSLFSFILYFVIFLLSFFFLLKDGHKFLRILRRIVPMKNEYKDALFLNFKNMTQAVFVGSIFIAFMQGALVGIGFFFAGLGSPFFWGLIASFMALLPFLGAALIWMPGAIYAFFAINPISGIGLFMYGFLIISTSDNLVRPILMSTKVKVNEFLVFLSILGGMNTFGFLGLFLGPIIVSLLISVINLYKLDFK